MKKQKKLNQEFHYRDKSPQEMIDQLNEEFPVSLKHNEGLVDRVCARYPFINKSEVSLIVNAVFSSFRDLLVLGKILNFNTLFFDAKLFFSTVKKKIFPALRVQVSTPPKLKKKDKQ